MKCDRRWWNDDGAGIAREQARIERRARAATRLQAPLDLLAFPAMDEYMQRIWMRFGTTRPAPLVFEVRPVSYYGPPPMPRWDEIRGVLVVGARRDG